MNRQQLRAFEKKLGLAFADPALLRQAFVHRSYANESKDPNEESNERLEFLGDAIVGAIVADYLYAAHPDRSEGDLTTLRSALVRRETLAGAAERLGIARLLIVGRGVDDRAIRTRTPVLASAFEALVAAIYLDRGLDASRQFLLGALGPDLAGRTSPEAVKDAKSRLQEIVQARWHITPVYRTIGAVGPDHAKRYSVEVGIAGDTIGAGTGPTKQAAQQAAAEDALGRLSDDWRPSAVPVPEGNTRSSLDLPLGDAP